MEWLRGVGPWSEAILTHHDGFSLIDESMDDICDGAGMGGAGLHKIIIALRWCIL
jgi:hypothetical protein